MLELVVVDTEITGVFGKTSTRISNQTSKYPITDNWHYVLYCIMVCTWFLLSMFLLVLDVNREIVTLSQNNTSFSISRVDGQISVVVL